MRFLTQTPSLDYHERPAELLNEAPTTKRNQPSPVERIDLTETADAETIDLTTEPRTVEVPFTQPVKKAIKPLTRCKPQEKPSGSNNRKPDRGNNPKSYQQDWVLPSIKFSVQKIRRS